MKNRTLSDYVKYRNGVTLGGKGSLTNMLKKSFGAGSIKEFWHYWNPIWGYYLSKFIYQPLTNIFPKNIATLVTFMVSGFVHDLAVFIIKAQFSLFLTTTFLFFSIGFVASEYFKFHYPKLSFSLRVLIHLSYLVICILSAIYILNY